MDAQRSTTRHGAVIAVIAITIILMFVGIWGWILVRTILDPTAPIENQFVVAAGTLSTLLASLTAAAIGSAVAEIKAASADEVRRIRNAAPPVVDQAARDHAVDEARSTVNVVTVAEELSWRTKTAIFSYLIVGLAVLAVWLVFDEASPEIVASFALSIVGWLVGAAGVVFEGPPVPGVSPTDQSGRAASIPSTTAKPPPAAPQGAQP